MDNNRLLDERRISLQNIVEDAIRAFNESELYLVENDVNERCICSRFAFLLSEKMKNTEYCEYTIDVEYNRESKGDQQCTKKLLDKPITVDLIVHKRGYDSKYGFDNLIVIEMKKSTDRRGCSSDEDRLSKMVSYEYGFCYEAGFMIVINMERQQAGMEIKKAFFL